MAKCARERKFRVQLKDVMQEGKTKVVGAKILQCSDDDGIVITTGRSQDSRVIIENYKGKLVCHIWTKEAARRGADPTRTIELD